MFWEWGKERHFGLRKGLVAYKYFFCLKPIQTKPIFKLFWAVRKYALFLQRCRLSVKILSWCPHKDQITGKEDKPIKCWNGKPLAENLCVWCETAIKYIEVYWQKGKNTSWGLKSGSMPFCTVRMSSHMHKSAHVINWPVWSFFFPEN